MESLIIRLTMCETAHKLQCPTQCDGFVVQFGAHGATFPVHSWPWLLWWVPKPTTPPTHPLICATHDLSRVGKIYLNLANPNGC